MSSSPPVDQSSNKKPEYHQDDASEEDSDDEEYSSGDDDASSNDDDDDEEMMAPAETDEERKQRALEAKEAGNDCFRSQDYKQALVHYNEAVEADPTSAMFLNNRAAAHLQLSHYEQAISDGKACVALDDTYFKGWYRLATAYLKSGDLDTCRATLTQAYLRDTHQQEKTSTMQSLVDDVEQMIAEATQLIAEKKYSQAVRTVFKCQKHVPGWSGLLVMRCEGKF